MSTIVTHAGKGSELTHAEVDANFNNLNDEVQPATKGGTGASSFTVGDIFYANTTTTLAKLPVSATTYQTLRSNGAGAAPSWAAVYLTSASATQGTLPIIRGGTGANSLTAGMVKSDGTTMSRDTMMLIAPCSPVWPGRVCFAWLSGARLRTLWILARSCYV